MDTTEKSQSRTPSKTTNNEPYGSNWRHQESQLTSNSPLKNNKQTIPSVFPNVFSDTDFDQLSSNGMDLKRLDPNAKESMDPAGYPDMSSWDYMMNVPIRVYNEAEGMDPFTLDTIQDSTMDLSLDPMSADYAQGGNFASAPSSLGSNPAFVTTPSNGSNENNSLPTSNDLDVPLSPSANADYNAAAATQNMSVPPPLTPSLPAVNDSSFSNNHMQLPSQVMPDGTGSIPNVDGNPFDMDPPSLEAGLLSSQQIANGIKNNDPAIQNYHFRQQHQQPQQQKPAPPPVAAPAVPSSPLSLKQEQAAVPPMFSSTNAKDSSTIPVKQEEFGLSPKNYPGQAFPAQPNLSQAFQMYTMNQNPHQQPNMSMNGDAILDYNAYPVPDDASLDYPTVQRSQALAQAADSLLPSSPSANAKYGSQNLDGVSDMLPSQMQNPNQFPQESLPPSSNRTYPIPINNSYRPKRPSLVLGSMNSLSPTQPPVVVPSNTTLSPSPTSTSPMKNSFANGGFASFEATKPQASVVEPPPAPPLANMSLTEKKEDHPVAAAASVAASGEKDSIPVDTTPTPSATTSAGTQRKRRKFKFGKQAGPVRCTLPNRTTGETCNTVFSRTYDLIRHQDTIHAKTRPVFRCEICGDQRHFSRHDALVRHLRVKHGR